MLVLRISFLVSLTTALLVNGQEGIAIDSNMLLDDGWELIEHFYEPLTSFVNKTENDLKQRGNLRRELQSQPVCRATPATGNIFVCGGWAGGAHDPCRNSQATCSGLTYGCSCSGSSETACSYCQLRGANAILCQQSGSRTTFRDLSGNVVTCSCEYIGNGQVSQNCYQPTPATIPALTSAPVDVRAPPAPIATPGIPIPGVVPPPALSPVAPIMPPQTPPINTQVTCQATNPFNINIGLGGTCSAIQNYACACSGSSETSCSYCQVRTYNAIICQVTGSDVTFIDPTGVFKTCHCEYRGNGQVQQYCYEEGGGTAAANPPQVWTPTSQRAPTMPVSPPTFIPVPVPVPMHLVVSSPNKKSDKKSNKQG